MPGDTAAKGGGGKRFHYGNLGANTVDSRAPAMGAAVFVAGPGSRRTQKSVNGVDFGPIDTTVDFSRTQLSRKMCVAVAALALGALSVAAARAASVPSSAGARPVGKPGKRNAVMDAKAAAAVADAVCRQIKGGKVLAVAPNGNMRPMFETNALVVVEPAPVDTVRVGDMVTYEHPTLRETVVQRVTAKRDGAIWAQDGKKVDAIAVQSGLMRVVAILYVRETGAPGLLASKGPDPAPAEAGGRPGSAAAMR